MGTISPDVDVGYFKAYSEHRPIVATFTYDFDINYAREYKKYGTVLHLFLIKPSKTISSIFGLSEEILLVYSYYDRLEPRTIQAIEAALSEPPFNMRANPLVFFLISNDPRGSEWVDKYLIDHPQFRTPIVFNENVARENGQNRSFVRSSLYASLFSSLGIPFTQGHTTARS